MSISLIKRYARYNKWAYETLLNCMSSMSDTDYHGHVGLCFRSIHGTLNHLLLADRLWYSRLTNTSDPKLAPYWQHTEIYAKPNDSSIFWEDYIKDRHQLKDSILSQANLLIEYVDTLPNSIDLDDSFSYSDSSGTKKSMPLGTVLLHVVNHGTHHRGQITAVCPRFGLPPPSIDFIYFDPTKSNTSL
ncbi:hypothetical protein BC833DRAFT_587394, partial [Globomyces pollinis-pini]